MADGNSGSGGIGILGVLIGAAIVAVVGFFLLNGNVFNQKKVLDVEIKLPSTSR